MIRPKKDMKQGRRRRLTGEYKHSLDSKGRLFIPARFREELGESFFITKGLDNCIAVYSEESWNAIEEKTRALPLSKSRNLQRMLFASAVKCELDSQGRILIPAKLREYAGLLKDVLVIGVSSRAEIWDAMRWKEIEDSQFTPENLAETMEELGF